MVTANTNGLDWYQDKVLGDTTAEIDTIAVGSGTGSEGPDATSLTAEEYRADKTNANVEFVKLSNPGKIEAIIRVKGGTEITAGTEISEMLVEASGDSQVIGIDNFAGIPVESGHTEEFTMPIDLNEG